jgi:hypothetical protein
MVEKESSRSIKTHLNRLQDSIYSGTFSHIRDIWGIPYLSETQRIDDISDGLMMFRRSGIKFLESELPTQSPERITLYPGNLAESAISCWHDESSLLHKIVLKFRELYGEEFTSFVLDEVSDQSVGYYGIRKKHFLLAGLLMGEGVAEEISGYLEEYQQVKSLVGLSPDMANQDLDSIIQKGAVLFGIEEFQPFYFGECLLFFQKIYNYVKEEDMYPSKEMSNEVYQDHFIRPVIRLVEQLKKLGDWELVNLCLLKAQEVSKRKLQRREDWFAEFTQIYLELDKLMGDGLETSLNREQRRRAPMYLIPLFMILLLDEKDDYKIFQHFLSRGANIYRGRRRAGKKG